MASLSGKRVLVTLPVDEDQRRAFAELIEAAGAEAVFTREPQVDETLANSCSAIIGNVPARTLHAPAGLQWLQTSSAGYDHYLAPGTLAAGTLLTNATGAYGQAVSEHMFAQLLCLMKKLHLYRDNQRTSLWKDEGPVRSLVGANVLVLGTGDIGSHFARLAVAMGAHVVGVRRASSVCPEPFERVVGFDVLHEELALADVVACALPSTPETRGLVGERFLAAMRPESYLVNAGRGDLVDSAALVDALASGHLAGAALDVTSPEPLPKDDPLWCEPNALITPHVAGFWHLQATTDNVVAICRANLEAFLAGRELRNVVER